MPVRSLAARLLRDTLRLAPMTTPTLWRVVILVATLLCIAMMFAPLVSTVVERLAEEPYLNP